MPSPSVCIPTVRPVARVRAAPRTPGSISFKLDGTPLLFTGDTLFPGGPGNTSFPDADFDTIIHSITTKLFTFPDDTIVLPGHGDNTTIGTERPHLEEWIERRW